MTIFYIGLGSNVGDRRAAIERAAKAIAALTGVQDVRMSPIYETPPMGPRDQGPYLNAVLEGRTNLSPRNLLEKLEAIEAGLGREPVAQRQHWGPRVIDLDILLYDAQVIDQPGLKVPHPGMAQRWFVLKPLADLAPKLRHPVTGMTIEQMLAAVENKAAD